MVFSSITFIYLYLPITLIVYYLTPTRYRNFWLLLVNLVFYGYGEPVYLILMLASIVLNYFSGYMIEKLIHSRRRLAKCILVANTLINLALLIFFKYIDFFIRGLAHISLFSRLRPIGLALPIGISFYTFQAMSYPVDIYWGKTKGEKSFLRFSTYVSLFPQLIAGPIVRYTEVADSLVHREIGVHRIAKGVRRFTIGLAKKILLANNIGQLWNVYNAMPMAQLSVTDAWLSALAFTFQIYFDFSGYSDMAIGLGEMLGFTFPENFNYPYTSKSITEFWRKWHITLSSWFRDYVYIPLGGNRRGKKRNLLNIWIVWALTGLWHGASVNFLLWGIYYGILLTFEKLFLYKWLERCPTIVQHFYTMLLVVMGWVIFSITDLHRLLGYLGVMFFVHADQVISAQALYYLRDYGVVLIILIIGCSPFVREFHRKWNPVFKQVMAPVMIGILLLLCTAYLVDSTYNPFLYFRF